MLVTYDPEVDILMVYLKDPETPLGHAQELSDQVVAHYTAEEELASIEVLDASSFLPKDELLRHSVEHLIPLAKAAEITGLAHSTLRQLIFKKRLRAFKYGDIWVTTREWLEEYLRGRRYIEKEVVELYGVEGAPGVVEGIARVVVGEDEMDQVQPGDILVAPATGPSWTPLFGIIKGAVTDKGGRMAHAVIVGREYGIPTVVGTGYATTKLKTGDRVRVDGDLCRVYILRSP